MTLLSFDWLPLQGQHQQRSLLRHAGHQEETHRKQEMKRDNLLNVNLHRLHVSLLLHMNTVVTDLSFSRTVYKCALGGGYDTTLGGQQSSRKVRYCIWTCMEPSTSQLVSPPIPYNPAPPPPMVKNLFLGFPKAQLPCFRCKCMQMGYNTPICLCLCVCMQECACYQCTRHLQYGCLTDIHSTVLC